MGNGFDREISFEITERIGVIDKSNTGWSLEINKVSWNGGKPKYDLRNWNEDYTRMTRGITLTEMQMEKLVELVSGDRAFE